MFRSEEMDLIEIRMPTETSHRVVYQLAASGSLMFRDLNPDQSAFQKEYASNLQRLSDIESKLHFVEKQCEEFKRPIRQMSETNTYAFDLEQTEVRVPAVLSSLLPPPKSTFDAFYLYCRRRRRRR